jgi:hypothetical protein
LNLIIGNSDHIDELMQYIKNKDMMFHYAAITKIIACQYNLDAELVEILYRIPYKEEEVCALSFSTVYGSISWYYFVGVNVI